MSKEIQNITVLGYGSWGTALALILEKKGYNVTLWGHEDDYTEKLQKTYTHSKYLPNLNIPKSIAITGNLADAVKSGQMIIVAVPSHVLRTLLEQMKPNLGANVPLVSVIKGIEQKTLFRVDQIVKDVLGPWPLAILSGPTHAEEVVHHLPSAIVACAEDQALADLVQNVFLTDYFRVYTSTDVIGVELGGALKNIIAIAIGIVDGLGLGDNSKAALLTRGMSEIVRLGVALGAQEKTFYGLSGMGDLIVTCMSEHSRNRHVGEQIGQGQSLDDVLASMTMVAEGVKTTQSAYELAKRERIEMPIISSMYDILFNNKAPKVVMKDLMQRDVKPE